MSTIKISGSSDDIIEVDGDINDEFEGGDDRLSYPRNYETF